METRKRRTGRTKAVLPVRIKGTDSGGKAFEELAHTLDVTPTGVRLGAIRRELSFAETATERDPGFAASPVSALA